MEQQLKHMYFNKLKISFLKSYIKNHINTLKKIQKKHLQFGGNRLLKKSEQKEKLEGEEGMGDNPAREIDPIRVPLVSTFIHDAPNIIIRSIEIFHKMNSLIEIFTCLANKYDTTGVATNILQLINQLMGFMRVFIRYYGFIIKLFSGHFNDGIIQAIDDFEASLLENQPEVIDPKVADFIKNHEDAHKIMTGGNPVNMQNIQNVVNNRPPPEVGPEAANELAAIVNATQTLVNEIDKSGKIVSSEIDDVLSKKINPMQQLNHAISDAVRIGMDAIKAIPGVGAIGSAVGILDKLTKNADRILSIIETNVTLIEQIIDKNVTKKPNGECVLESLEAIITLSRLVDQSPEVAKLIKAASVNIAEDVIDNTFKNPDPDEYLDSNWPLEYLARDTLRGLENRIGDEKIESMESLKQSRLKALEEQHDNSHVGGSIGFAFKQSLLKKKKRGKVGPSPKKKRTKSLFKKKRTKGKGKTKKRKAQSKTKRKSKI